MNFKTFYLSEIRNIKTERELRKYYVDVNYPVYFSFRDIKKLGINPNSKYDTPNGIYCYSTEQYGVDDFIPFRGGRKKGYIYFFKAKPDTKILDSREYDFKDMNADLKKLKTEFGGEEVDELYKKTKDEALVGSPLGFLWYVLYRLKTSANNWNHILRNILGYDLIVDFSGVLHTNEKKQCVFLNPTKIDVLEYGEYVEEAGENFEDSIMKISKNVFKQVLNNNFTWTEKKFYTDLDKTDKVYVIKYCLSQYNKLEPKNMKYEVVEKLGELIKELVGKYEGFLLYPKIRFLKFFGTPDASIDLLSNTPENMEDFDTKHVPLSYFKKFMEKIVKVLETTSSPSTAIRAIVRLVTLSKYRIVPEDYIDDEEMLNKINTQLKRIKGE